MPARKATGWVISQTTITNYAFLSLRFISATRRRGVHHILYTNLEETTHNSLNLCLVSATLWTAGKVVIHSSYELTRHANAVLVRFLAIIALLHTPPSSLDPYLFPEPLLCSDVAETAGPASSDAPPEATADAAGGEGRRVAPATVRASQLSYEVGASGLVLSSP